MAGFKNCSSPMFAGIPFTNSMSGMILCISAYKGCHSGASSLLWCHSGVTPVPPPYSGVTPVPPPYSGVTPVPPPYSGDTPVSLRCLFTPVPLWCMYHSGFRCHTGVIE